VLFTEIDPKSESKPNKYSDSVSICRLDLAVLLAIGIPWQSDFQVAPLQGRLEMLFGPRQHCRRAMLCFLMRVQTTQPALEMELIFVEDLWNTGAM